MPSRFRSHLTLALCTILHAFTHGYATMLVPLYLMMQKDLHLDGVAKVSWIVTVYGVIYFLGSYVGGMLADRFDRKLLLGVGLIGNATAILLMGFTHDYHTLIVLAVTAGVAGTLFHPAANALVPAHYPRQPGMAIGLLGIGAALGFWAGPQYAGWRAATATWHLAHVSAWQRPLVEAGIGGLIFGLIFLLIAREVPNAQVHRSDVNERSRSPKSANRRRQSQLGLGLTMRTLAVALVLGCRDMSGVASLSLISIYLLKAYHLDIARVGFILGTMRLLAIPMNPLAVYFTPGRLRLPALSLILLAGGAVIVTLPHWALGAVLPIMTAFMTLQLASYAVSDAAMLERVSPAHRGRVTGLFLTWAGTTSSFGPWIIGYWIDHMGSRAGDPHAYGPQFFSMALMMWLGAASSPLIARLGRPGEGPTPEAFTETTPATMPAIG